MTAPDRWPLIARWRPGGENPGWESTALLEPSADGAVVVRAAGDLTFFHPGGAPRTVRVTLRGVHGGGIVGAALERYGFRLGSEENPLSRISRVPRVLDVTGSPFRDAAAITEVQFERGEGRLCMKMDGRVLIEAADPYPDEGIGMLVVAFAPGTRFREIEVTGGSPARPVLPPPRAKGGYDLAVCIDLYDDLLHHPWREETFRQAMALHRRHRVRRIDFIDHGPPGDGFWRQPGVDLRHPGFQRNIDRTAAEVGDFLPAALRAAHREGLRFHAVFKPFEGGLFNSFPAGSALARRHGRIPGLGGWLWWCHDFVAAHPHLRMERDPATLPPDDWEPRAARMELRAPSGCLDPARLRLYSSRDNGTYRPCRIRPRLSPSADGSMRIVLDLPHGSERFFAIGVEGEPTRRFGNRLDALVTLSGPDGNPLPLTFSLRVNQPGRDFRENGFCIDTPGLGDCSALNDFFWLDGGVFLGVAVGVERYLQGALCPAFPEVRDWWLSRVDACLAAGVDGIDFRIKNHNRTFSWDAYGFNAPLREAVRRLPGSPDPAAWRRVRGEAYTAFLREAAARVRAAGRKVCLHVENEMNDPSWHTLMETDFDWRQWVREGLADSLTLKMLPSMRSGLAREALLFAREHGNLPVNFNPSLFGIADHPAGSSRLEWLIRDVLAGGADEFTLYENALVMRARADGSIAVTQPWVLEQLAAHASR